MTVSPPFPKSDPGRQRQKEPRFVPYEPYKAATTDFIPNRSTHVSRKVSRCLAGGSASEDHTKPVRSSAEPPKIENLESKSPLQDKFPEEEKLLSLLLEESNAKIKKMEAKLAESEKQLKIQMRVNTEVKKLLVASVGEDIEAKVDYLTQDKARLAADIRQYSSIMTRDFEEKEKLSVESDLWKSKFLACSLIVDDLARSKATLGQKCDSFDHHVRLLLHERKMLWDSLNGSIDALAHLNTAFNPLSALDVKATDHLGSYSVLGLAELAVETSNKLEERLLGQQSAPRIRSSLPVEREIMDTPAEEGLREIVSSKPADEDYCSQASIAITGKARPYLAKMNDKLASPDIHSSLFKCCTHCQGSVQMI